MIHIITTHYNSLHFLKICISSILSQNVSIPFRVHLIDDCSTEDGVQSFLDSVQADPRVQIRRTTERVGKGMNIINYIETADVADDDIVCLLDGDDWFASPSALQTVVDTYSRTGCWVTYGSYIQSNRSKFAVTQPMTPAHYESERQGNGFRKAPWIFSHLFTAKAFLWKKLTRDLLMFDGVPTMFTSDQLLNLPIAEMAGSSRIQNIPIPLVVYNMTNPISDHYIDRTEQRRIDILNRKRPAFAKIEI